MKKLELQGNWNEQKGKLQKQFSVLSDSDLKYEEGQKNEMLGKIQKKLGKTEEEFQKILKSL